MAYLSEAKSKAVPLNEFMARFVKLSKRFKSASDALKEAKRVRK
jgi:hypothetical protein